MSLTNISAAGQKKAGFVKTRIEEGTYIARITQLIDMGIQKSEYEGIEKEKHEVSITFEFPTETIKINDEDKPRWLSKTYTVSTHEKAGLLKLVSAADPEGKATSKGRNLKGLLTLPLMVSVGSTQTDNAKVSSVSRLMKGMVVPELAQTPTFFDLDDTDIEQFKKFPSWMQEKIVDGIGFDHTKFGKALNTGVTPNSTAAEKEESPY